MPISQSITAMMEKLALNHGLSITLTEGQD
jgi:hypothetical protein